MVASKPDNVGWGCAFGGGGGGGGKDPNRIDKKYFVAACLSCSRSSAVWRLRKKKDENVENLPNTYSTYERTNTCTIDFSHHCKYYVYNAISLGCLASGGSINCLLDMINDPTETDKRATLIILAGEVRSEEASTVQFS